MFSEDVNLVDLGWMLGNYVSYLSIRHFPTKLTDQAVLAYNQMASDKMSKPEPDQAMEAAADGHFSGLHSDEYPVTKHLGANKVPFVIGRSLNWMCFRLMG